MDQTTDAAASHNRRLCRSRVRRVDLDAVRTFVAAADAGQFQEAAAALSITQQAVSKRIAALEKDLAVRLFTRTARGAQLTIDGQAFLPHARELLRVAERADASVRPGRRALRVDVISRRIAPAVLLQDFHRAHPEIELDVVTLDRRRRRRRSPPSRRGRSTPPSTPSPSRAPDLPDAIRTARVIDEPHQLLVGPGHAARRRPRGHARAARRTPDLDARHGRRYRVGRLLRRTRRRVRAHHRRARAGLRQRGAAGRDRRLRATWRRWSANARGTCGRTATTCGAYRCATRPRSTRCRSSGATTTRIPRSRKLRAPPRLPTYAGPRHRGLAAMGVTSGKVAVRRRRIAEGGRHRAGGALAGWPSSKIWPSRPATTQKCT